MYITCIANWVLAHNNDLVVSTRYLLLLFLCLFLAAAFRFFSKGGRSLGWFMAWRSVAGVVLKDISQRARQCPQGFGSTQRFSQGWRRFVEFLFLRRPCRQGKRLHGSHGFGLFHFGSSRRRSLLLQGWKRFWLLIEHVWVDGATLGSSCLDGWFRFRLLFLFEWSTGTWSNQIWHWRWLSRSDFVVVALASFFLGSGGGGCHYCTALGFLHLDLGGFFRKLERRHGRGLARGFYFVLAGSVADGFGRGRRDNQTASVLRGGCLGSVHPYERISSFWSTYRTRTGTIIDRSLCLRWWSPLMVATRLLPLFSKGIPSLAERWPLHEGGL